MTKIVQKYFLFFFTDIICDSPGILFPGLKGVTKTGKNHIDTSCLPSSGLPADREKV